MNRGKPLLHQKPTQDYQIALFEIERYVICRSVVCCLGILWRKVPKGIEPTESHNYQLSKYEEELFALLIGRASKTSRDERYTDIFSNLFEGKSKCIYRWFTNNSFVLLLSLFFGILLYETRRIQEITILESHAIFHVTSYWVHCNRSENFREQCLSLDDGNEDWTWTHIHTHPGYSLAST